MQNSQKIILGFVSLSIILVVMNIIYAKCFYEQDIQKHSDIINLVREVQDSSNIIYISESSNFSFRSDDLVKRRISDFISDYYPNKKFGTINKGALHSGNFKILLSQIPDKSNVETVIVTLNLRSFNAQWIYSELETALQKQMVLLKKYPPLVNRFLLSFKGYDIKTNQERNKQFKRKWKRDVFDADFPEGCTYKTVTEWDANMCRDGIKNPDGTENRELTALACHYIKAYAFQIDTNINPRIKDFDEIVDLAKERNWNLVFNLLAENVDKAQELVGKDLVFLMNENRELLLNRYKNKGVLVVDNLTTVEDEQFIDQNWTTEHYAEKGRRAIAENVADSLRRIYPKQYHKVKNPLPVIKTHFFNDCEGKNVWGQMGTISDKMAFSGQKSSQTGGDAKFGVTFEYPVALIPDSINTVKVSMKVNKSEINSDVKIIAELSGKEFDFTWLNQPVNVSKENVWQDLSFSFQLNEKYRKADLVKIYLYNPTKTIVFVDDINIDFETK